MRHAPGRLEVICGPMFAGKTTELVRRLALTPGAVAVKPTRDTRYATDELVSHDGLRLPAIAVADAHALALALERIGSRHSGSAGTWPGESSSCGPEALATSNAVGIDEAHFFGNALTPVCTALVERGVRVVVAGIERDHRGRPFEPFPALLCEADEVIKLTARCAACGRPAIHSQRMVADDSPIVVGGAELYEPRCRACFSPIG